MPDDRAFFDSNVLIYAFAIGDRRRETALRLLLRGGTIGVQTLNEFVNVYTGRMRTPWPEVLTWLQATEELGLAVVPLTMSVHRRGIEIAEATRYHIYDALMLAAALEASCTVFYSEDMQDGQNIGGMTIRNPFTSPAR